MPKTKAPVVKSCGVYTMRNLYAGQEATVRTGHEITDWFQIGKGVHQGRILSLCLFKLHADYIMSSGGQQRNKVNIYAWTIILEDLC